MINRVKYEYFKLYLVVQRNSYKKFKKIFGSTGVPQLILAGKASRRGGHTQF